MLLRSKAMFVPANPSPLAFSALMSKDKVSNTYINHDHSSDFTDYSRVLPFWHGVLMRTRLKCVWTLV